MLISKVQFRILYLQFVNSTNVYLNINAFEIAICISLVFFSQLSAHFSWLREVNSLEKKNWKDQFKLICMQISLWIIKMLSNCGKFSYNGFIFTKQNKSVYGLPGHSHAYQNWLHTHPSTREQIDKVKLTITFNFKA